MTSNLLNTEFELFKKRQIIRRFPSGRSCRIALSFEKNSAQFEGLRPALVKFIGLQSLLVDFNRGYVV